MEMEQRTPLMPKKLCGIIRAILYLLKKDLSKTIPWFSLHMMLKRSTKLAGKAIGSLLLLDHQTLSSALTCRPNDIHTTFIPPIEYEFSCSSTPLFHPKRKNHRRYSGAGGLLLHRRSHKNRELTVSNVRKAFDVLNSFEAAAVGPEDSPEYSPGYSPLTGLGFGGSENVRQLRVTDSPFPVGNAGEDGGYVDMAAEEFIKKFYVELKRQRNRAAVEPPSPVFCRKWGQVAGDEDREIRAPEGDEDQAFVIYYSGSAVESEGEFADEIEAREDGGNQGEEIGLGFESEAVVTLAFDKQPSAGDEGAGLPFAGVYREDGGGDGSRRARCRSSIRRIRERGTGDRILRERRGRDRGVIREKETDKEEICNDEGGMGLNSNQL
ncbi:hypothetical protein SSX86_009826 [Deinandra increscens subsp. villosa]|uniref:Uncharacterized protein n=1 Tax=Deinandra increscens subsp. villosa TaxID=3103831 RepID=A0AAP0DHQ4_9ASTR